MTANLPMSGVFVNSSVTMSYILRRIATPPGTRPGMAEHAAPGGRMRACLEPTSRGTRRPPAPPSSTSPARRAACRSSRRAIAAGDIVRVPRVPDWQLRNLMRFEVEEIGDQRLAHPVSDLRPGP